MTGFEPATTRPPGMYFFLVDICIFLKGFEQHFYQRGCTGGGVHNYMRTLRAIYNEVIKRGYVSRDVYPFKSQLNTSGYSLANLKSVAVPRALSLEDIEKIKAFDLKYHPKLNLPWKIFMFTYYAYGINFADLILLKSTHIRNGRIVYTRAKTGKEYAVAISPPMQAILDEFKRSESEYLFPVLTETQHQNLKGKGGEHCTDFREFGTYGFKYDQSLFEAV